MTLTLSPELAQAIEEKAQEEGTTPECAVILALERVFVDGEKVYEGKKPGTAEWDDLIHPHHDLVVKTFMTGLTAKEEKELERLGAEIDAEESSHPIILPVVSGKR